jgi:uncharacterized integral membrane protein
MSWKLWVAGGLLVLLALFALQNTAVVTVRLLLWKLEMSRSILLLVVLAVGFASGWLVGTLRRRAGPAA